MFTEEFDIALHRIALSMDEYDQDVDLMDIEGLCVPFDDAWDNDTVPGSMTFDSDDIPPFNLRG